MSEEEDFDVESALPLEELLVDFPLLFFEQLDKVLELPEELEVHRCVTL